MLLPRLAALLAAIAWQSAAAPFTPNNLVLLRLGTGSAALGTSTTAAFLDEYSTTGTSATLVQSIALPTAASSGNPALTVPVVSTTDTHGQLELSADGYSLLLTGYDTGPGSTTYTATSVKRVVARFDSDGEVEYTSWTPASTHIVNAVASVNGSAYYVAAQNAGIYYVPHNATAAVSIFVSIYRTAALLYGTQLVGSRGGGNSLQYFPVALPTTTQAQQIAMSTSATYSDSRAPVSTSLLEVYVADTGSGLYRQTRTSSTSNSWTKSSAIRAGSGSTVTNFLDTALNYTTLYVTTSAALYAYNTVSRSWLNGGNAILNAPTNTQFRGVARVPAAPPPSPTPSPSASVTPSISVTPSVTPSSSITASPSVTATATATSTSSTTASPSPSKSPIDFAAVARQQAADAAATATGAAIGGAVGAVVLIVGGGLIGWRWHRRATVARLRKLKASAAIARKGPDAYFPGLNNVMDVKSENVVVMYTLQQAPRPQLPSYVAATAGYRPKAGGR